MNATNHHGAALARRQSGHRMDPRLAERRIRNALQEVIRNPALPSGQRTPCPEYPWHDNTRAEPRAQLVCAKERELLEAAISQGCTTPAQVIEYYLVRIEDSLAHFESPHEARELVYIKLAIDEAEALQAQSVDHALPSPEHRRAAVEATHRVELDARLFCELR
jgi:hypothetical protein